MAHQRGCTPSHIHKSKRCFCRYIGHVKYRLNTFYGLKLDMYNPLDTLESFKEFLGISDIFDVFMTPLMSDFFVILQCFATASDLGKE